jgi:hypothetical protein
MNRLMRALALALTIILASAAAEARESRAKYPDHTWEPEALVLFSTADNVPKALLLRVLAYG